MIGLGDLLLFLKSPIGRKFVLYAGVLFCFIGTHIYAYHAGGAARDRDIAAENAALEKQRAEAYRVQVDFGNLKAAEVQEQEKASVAMLTEVLTNVPKVTTNRPCLSGDAVRLLNGSRKGAGLPLRTGDNEKESPGDTATDTDIAQWAAKANEQYERCAANNNGIIDIISPTNN